MVVIVMVSVITSPPRQLFTKIVAFGLIIFVSYIFYFIPLDIILRHPTLSSSLLSSIPIDI